MLGRYCVVVLILVSSLGAESFTAVLDEEVESQVLEWTAKDLNQNEVCSLSSSDFERTVAFGNWIFKFPQSEAQWAVLVAREKLLKILQKALPQPIPQYKLNVEPNFVAYKAIGGRPLSGVIYRGLSPQKKSVFIRDLAHFMLSLHSIPTHWARSQGLSLQKFTDAELALISLEVRRLFGSDPGLVGFFEYSLAEFVSSRKDDLPVICHGDLRGANLLVDGVTGELTGVVGFNPVICSRVCDFDFLFDIDADLARQVISHYAQLRKIPDFFDEARHYRAVHYFVDLVAAHKAGNLELSKLFLRKIQHIRESL